MSMNKTIMIAVAVVIAALLGYHFFGSKLPKVLQPAVK